MTMIKIYEKYKMIYLTDENEGVTVGFTTKHGGVSKDYLSTMNMSFNRKESHENVVENYRRFTEALDLKNKEVHVNNQVHGDNINTIPKSTKDIADNSVVYSPDSQYDAHITDSKDIALAVLHADCIPILFYDSENMVIGAVHSGWKGTVLEIAAKTVDVLKNKFHIKPQNLTVWIGPVICEECFEIRADVYKEFTDKLKWSNEFIKQKSEEHYLIDLKAIVNKSLLNSGVLQENIKDFKLCTSCNDGLFYSHRRDCGKTGTLAGIIALK